MTSSFSILDCFLKGCFGRCIFCRAKLCLKGIEDFNLGHWVRWVRGGETKYQIKEVIKLGEIRLERFCCSSKKILELKWEKSMYFCGAAATILVQLRHAGFCHTILVLTRIFWEPNKREKRVNGILYRVVFSWGHLRASTWQRH